VVAGKAQNATPVVLLAPMQIFTEGIGIIRTIHETKIRPQTRRKKLAHRPTAQLRQPETDWLAQIEREVTMQKTGENYPCFRQLFFVYLQT
jgi:hypothetical protein